MEAHWLLLNEAPIMRFGFLESLETQQTPRQQPATAIIGGVGLNQLLKQSGRSGYSPQ